MDFTAGNMYIDLSSDQVYYIEVLSQTFASSTTVVGTVPDSVTIEFRFKTFDVTNPEKFKTDGFALTVMSSQETLDNYCEYTQLRFLPGSMMSENDPMNYTVTEQVKSEFSERQYWPLTTEVEGWQSLSPTCYDPIVKAFEVEIEEDTWMTIWSEKTEREQDSDDVLQVVDGIAMSFFLSQE
jgi:hypothetical protein